MAGPHAVLEIHAPLRGALVGTKLGVLRVGAWLQAVRLIGDVRQGRLGLACRLPSPIGHGPFEAVSGLHQNGDIAPAISASPIAVRG